jgi:hypothetical protein
MKSETPPKIIFGLSPRATIINSLVLLFIGQFFWAYKFLQQLPPGFDINNVPADFKMIDNVPWFYDMPFTILSVVMGLTWIQFVYKIENGDFSWRAIKYKYLYLMGSLFLIQSIMKLFLLLILV